MNLYRGQCIGGRGARAEENLQYCLTLLRALIVTWDLKGGHQILLNLLLRFMSAGRLSRPNTRAQSESWGAGASSQITNSQVWILTNWKFGTPFDPISMFGATMNSCSCVLCAGLQDSQGTTESLGHGVNTFFLNSSHLPMILSFLVGFVSLRRLSILILMLQANGMACIFQSELKYWLFCCAFTSIVNVTVCSLCNPGPLYDTCCCVIKDQYKEGVPMRLNVFQKRFF